MSGVIQQVGDTCLQLSLDLLVLKIENILSLLSIARVLVFKSGFYVLLTGERYFTVMVLTKLTSWEELWETH